MSNCFEFGNILTSECLKYFTVNLFGIVIFMMSWTLKVPQIISIYKNKSSKGVSSMSIYTDFFNVVASGLNCMKFNLPFSIYGEFISLILQNLIIVILYAYYNRNNNTKIIAFIIILITSILCFIGIYTDIYPSIVWDFIAASNLPFVTISRGSQYISLYKNKEVGSLSIESFLMRTFKNLIKMITLILETDKYILILNQGYNALLGLIMIIMILYYKSKVKTN